MGRLPVTQGVFDAVVDGGPRPKLITALGAKCIFRVDPEEAAVREANADPQQNRKRARMALWLMAGIVGVLTGLAAVVSGPVAVGAMSFVTVMTMGAFIGGLLDVVADDDV
ncbi:hypothetical protein [Mycolicibacterium fortuitum]|uniref:hypothetical protein n=1 Tax=Mycolicibacterium fortuitum TaxID=1766 RepID=UPI00261FF211|nr:hypothetical protein [Mycolicibacterium fortuitum]